MGYDFMDYKKMMMMIMAIILSSNTGDFSLCLDLTSTTQMSFKFLSFNCGSKLNAV